MNKKEERDMREWSFRPPEGENYFSYQLTIMHQIWAMDDEIYVESSGKMCGKTLVCGSKVAWLLSALPQAYGVTPEQAVASPSCLGRLDRWELYRDLDVPRDEIHLRSPDGHYSCQMRVINLPPLLNKE